jgi:hypothetical protein
MTLEMVGAVLGCVLFIGTIKYWLSNKKKKQIKLNWVWHLSCLFNKEFHLANSIVELVMLYYRVIRP